MHLLDPYFYSIFELSNAAKNRLLGLALLYSKEVNIIEALVIFLCNQLILKLSSTESMDNLFMAASELISGIISLPFLEFLSQHGFSVEEKNPELIIKNFMQPYLQELGNNICLKIEETTEVHKLSYFISNFSPKFGLPCV